MSQALRLTDGALILVDVAEGVSSSTLRVLRQCYQERVKPLLVLNKIDRLKNELEFDTETAYQHLSMIIDLVNVALGRYISSDLASRLQIKNRPGRKLNKAKRAKLQERFNKMEEEAEERLLFSPEKGNVIFCSAIDQWAFTIEEFAK